MRESGLAIPLVRLLFGSFWLFPLITALVAGDIVASEDDNGTLKTILTRSVDRGQVFAGKALAALTYAFAALALFGLVAVVAGSAGSGFDPLVDLSGHRSRRAGRCCWSAPASLVYLLPIWRSPPSPPALDRDPKQRGGRGRHADVLADMQLIGILPGAGLPAARTCSRRSSTRGRAFFACRPTGRRSCAACG